jgi:hypothetical protein
LSLAGAEVLNENSKVGAGINIKCEYEDEYCRCLSLAGNE